MSTTTAAKPAKSPTQVTTGVVRLSYAYVWEKRKGDDGKEKYSTAIIIPKSDTNTVNAIKKAIEEAKKEGKEKWGGKIPSNLKVSLRDGDVDKEDDPAYKNSYFLNASSTTRPNIVDRACNVILDQDEVYSGVYARVSLNFYAYNHPAGGKGVAAGLNNIMKWKDGEPFAGKTKPEDDFNDDFNDEASEFE